MAEEVRHDIPEKHKSLLQSDLSRLGEGIQSGMAEVMASTCE
jgi:hypothetical protein